MYKHLLGAIFLFFSIFTTAMDYCCQQDCTISLTDLYRYSDYPLPAYYSSFGIGGKKIDHAKIQDHAKDYVARYNLNFISYSDCYLQAIETKKSENRAIGLPIRVDTSLTKDELIKCFRLTVFDKRYCILIHSEKIKGEIVSLNHPIVHTHIETMPLCSKRLSSMNNASFIPGKARVVYGVSEEQKNKEYLQVIYTEGKDSSSHVQTVYTDVIKNNDGLSRYILLENNNLLHFQQPNANPEQLLISYLKPRKKGVDNNIYGFLSSLPIYDKELFSCEITNIEKNSITLSTFLENKKVTFMIPGEFDVLCKKLFTCNYYLHVCEKVSEKYNPLIILFLDREKIAQYYQKEFVISFFVF